MTAPDDRARVEQPAPAECPTPMHHPLTVCRICHPEQPAPAGGGEAARRDRILDEMVREAEELGLYEATDGPPKIERLPVRVEQPAPAGGGELLNARVRFWTCKRHRRSRVEWRGDVARCLEAGCGRTSEPSAPAGDDEAARRDRVSCCSEPDDGLTPLERAKVMAELERSHEQPTPAELERHLDRLDLAERASSGDQEAARELDTIRAASQRPAVLVCTCTSTMRTERRRCEGCNADDALNRLADPLTTAGVRLTAAGVARREVEELRDRDRLLRHYLGKIANRIGRPTRSTLREEGEIEEVGEGVLAEVERLRARDEAAKVVVQAWLRACSNDEVRARYFPPRLWPALDALARAHEDGGTGR